MLVKEIVGSVGFTVMAIGIAMAGITSSGSTEVAVASPVKTEVVCGVETSHYGSGVALCDGNITSWATGVNSTSIYVDEAVERTTTVSENGYVSEVSINKADGSITAYVG